MQKAPQWFVRIRGKINGPFTEQQIRKGIAEGTITPAMEIKQGDSDWAKSEIVAEMLERYDASTHDGASVGAGNRTASDTATEADADNFGGRQQNSPAAGPDAERILHSAKSQASKIYSELRDMDFKEEVLPVSPEMVQNLISDQSFVAILLLAVTPLFIHSLEGDDSKLVAFAMFFAAIWGLIFKSFVIPVRGEWKLLLGAFFFTGLFGMAILALFDAVLPRRLAVSLDQSIGFIATLPLQVCLVGIPEELCKALPVAGYLLWNRDKADPVVAILVGIFSGLGFAAFENVGYGRFFVTLGRLVEGRMTASLLSTQLLRVVSLTFCHAIFAGISAYFLSVANLTNRRLAALSIVGIGTAGILHGVYNTLADGHNLLAGVWVGGSFVLFFAYLEKLRRFTEAKAQLQLMLNNKT